MLFHCTPGCGCLVKPSALSPLPSNQPLQKSQSQPIPRQSNTPPLSTTPRPAGMIPISRHGQSQRPPLGTTTNKPSTTTTTAGVKRTESSSSSSSSSVQPISAQICIDEHKKYLDKQIKQSKEELTMLLQFEETMTSSKEGVKEQAINVYKQEMLKILDLRMKDLNEFQSKIRRLQ